MIFEETRIAGVWLVKLDRFEDARGFFARSWDRDVFAERGLNPELAQCSISHNPKRRTLRGMHYQAAPHQEAKLVRCTSGAIFDVALDLRQRSATFGASFGTTISAENWIALYVPEGCAHGFLTLADSTEVLYQISVPYHPDAARGVRWDDPAFGISWPDRVSVISERDRTYPDFAEISAETA